MEDRFDLLYDLVSPSMWFVIKKSTELNPVIAKLIQIYDSDFEYDGEGYLGMIGAEWKKPVARNALVRQLLSQLDKAGGDEFEDLCKWIVQKKDAILKEKDNHIDAAIERIFLVVLLLILFCESGFGKKSEIFDSNYNVDRNEIVTLFNEHFELKSALEDIWIEKQLTPTESIEQELTDEEKLKLIAALQEASAQSEFGEYDRAAFKSNLATLIQMDEASPDFQNLLDSLSSREAGQGTWVERTTKSPRRPTYLDVPEQAPELFNDRADKSEDDIAFTKRVYGAGGVDLLRADHTGLAMSDLSTLDEPLYEELKKTQKRLRGRKPSQELPDDCPLPKLNDRNRAVIEQINVGELQAPDDEGELNNLVAAASRMKIPFAPKTLSKIYK